MRPHENALVTDQVIEGEYNRGGKPIEYTTKISEKVGDCQEIIDKAINILGGNSQRPGDAMVVCPAHEDKNPSLHLECKDGKLLAHCMAGCSQYNVIQALKSRGLWLTGNREQSRSRPNGIPSNWYGKLYVAHWTYHSAPGKVIGHTVRYQAGDNKEVIPFFKREGGKWKSGGAEKPRPLYNLHDLHQHQSKPVLIVEGEKSADASRRLVGDFYVCVTWTGGTNAVTMADWQPLWGREVYIWPDADDPGRKAGNEVAEQCRKAGAKMVSVVRLPVDVQIGWDLADAKAEDWTGDQVRKKIENSMTVDDGCILSLSQGKSLNDGACDGYDGCDGFTMGNIFTLPEPPLSVFKSDIQYVLENISESKRCPIEIPIAGLLAVCSGLTGLSRKIQIKRGWTEPGNIYTALVAKSATGKGPGIHPFFRSLYAIEKAEHERYIKEHEEYEIALNVWQSSKRDNPEQPRPKPPVRKDCIIDDATIEAVADSLISNPRGILWNRDELSGLFRDFDKYNGEKGATKERLMSAYDAVVPWKLNRATGRQVGYIPNPCISIFGTIQTSVLGNTFTANDKNSGLLGRWIFIHAVPTVAPTFSDEEESLRTKNIIERLIHGLDRLPFEGEPRIVNVSSEAKQEYVRWHDKLAMEAWLSTDDGEGGLLSKIRAQGLRICLLLHLMDSVLSGQPEKAIIDADTMVRALRLMNWLKAHSQATWRFLGNKVKAPTGHEVRVAQAILDIQNKIYNSWLSTAEITKKCNHGHDDQYHLQTTQVGKICTRLSLEKKATAAAKGFVVTPADIDRLSFFNPRKTVISVTSVNPDNDGGFGYDASDCQPSLNVIKEGACDDIEVF